MDWSLFPGIGNSFSIGNGVVITSHASAHTKGNYSQLIASTPSTLHFLTIAGDYADGPYDWLFDIAIGAAGSEQVILSNLQMSTLSGISYRGAPFCAPISIPAGERISARCQSSTGNKNMYLGIIGYVLDFMKVELSPPLTYGANTADSGGTQIDCGAAAYTKGAYAQLVAATVRDHQGIVLGFGNILNAGRTAGFFKVDISIGAAGSEFIKVQDIGVGVSNSNNIPNPLFSIFYPVKIPIGSRLAARCSSGITDATDRLLDVIAYCF